MRWLSCSAISSCAFAGGWCAGPRTEAWYGGGAGRGYGAGPCGMYATDPRGVPEVGVP